MTTIKLNFYTKPLHQLRHASMATQPAKAENAKHGAHKTRQTEHIVIWSEK